MQASDAAVPTSAEAVSTGVASNAREMRIQRVLKAVVILLALMLLGGLATVVGRVIYLASPTRTQAVQGAEEMHEASPSLAIRPEQTLELPAGAHVRSVSLSGNRLAVHYDVGSATGIAVIDLQTGRKITNVAVEPKPAGN
jgi:hypothetical protein